MIQIWYIVIFFMILAIITFMYKNKEGFGYDNDPSQFIEPSLYPNFITKEQAKYILEMAEYNY